MSNLTFDVGLAAKLKVAFERNGWTAELIDDICAGNQLGQFREVVLDQACIVTNPHVIDCNAHPSIPDGMKVCNHSHGGLIQWSPDRISLYVCKDDLRWNHDIYGGQPATFEFRKGFMEKLKDMSVMNANVLDYLLDHPRLIPEKWQDKTVCFCGTLYRSGPLYRNGFKQDYFRCLEIGGNRRNVRPSVVEVSASDYMDSHSGDDSQIICALWLG
ncbi:MAG: hypothetical protein Q8P17_04495 [bacterium]|nr:hypothetical protein [bacterium]